MSARTCEVPGCGRRHLARGMCRMHYERDRRGAPLTVTPLKMQPAEARFWAKVDKRGPDECWLWLASKTGRDTAIGEGYGYFHNPDGSYYAHRYAYELLVGPVPDGMVLDHVKARGCSSRACVNPAHLEPVTNGENVRRGERWAS